MSIVVNTPTGNIGRALVTRLLDAGEAVTVISRNPAKVADLAERGVRVVEGSTDDPAVLDRAFAGAHSLFWLTPPAYQPRFYDWAVSIAAAAADAAVRHKIERVVVLSSVGAHSGPGTGPVSPMLAIEDTFRSALSNVLALRPGFFMENLLRSLDTLAGQSAIIQPIAADKKMPMVATRDIARVAADNLIAARWTGHRILGVHGPADLDHNQVAALVGEALGRPVSFMPVTVDQAREAMAGMGMPEFLVELFAEMYEAMADGRMNPAEERSAETTTETSLVEFARDVLAPALAQAA
ncbi:MAG: NmrA family NAD(P)-binding protein [Myxococcota bacterium]